MDGVDEALAREAFALAAAKLPIRTTFVQRSSEADGGIMGKNDELRAKSAAELNKELKDLRRAQFGLRMQAATQQLTKPARSSACAGASRGCTRPQPEGESERK